VRERGRQGEGERGREGERRRERERGKARARERERLRERVRSNTPITGILRLQQYCAKRCNSNATVI
jgi:hypothetical protein